MDFMKTIAIAASGLKAQSGRMRVIAENLANADSVAPRAGMEPYRRRVPTFETELNRQIGSEVVKLGRIEEDTSPFGTRYEPGHPAADARGYVQTPNVNSLIEQMDFRQAQRSYEANVGVVSATRRMISRTIDILRG
ncbi:flagellar basal-body rod protein FlgC [Agaricicola taiwanensis]|uniref:Flagellar basal-body rod protein FlgC n=1 Tax=Agaricicola taiwanensis TaxID=591372 RepID=A0A8J2VYN1_9RHOB|nr:flagellar basal body rod protein FlgC [Agaricicola taiwanensis]GGE40713.1 flagellar basal-body rod protein FlgC [Agaricicola taiwanensis]